MSEQYFNFPLLDYFSPLWMDNRKKSTTQKNTFQISTLTDVSIKRLVTQNLESRQYSSNFWPRVDKKSGRPTRQVIIFAQQLHYRKALGHVKLISC